jgi:hypothetical protein
MDMATDMAMEVAMDMTTKLNPELMPYPSRQSQKPKRISKKNASIGSNDGARHEFAN